MAASYHYKNSRASMRKHEPVYLSRFITTWVLPTPLQSIYGTEIITEQLQKIEGLNLDQLPETVEQFFRAHKRRYAGTKVETDIDLDMEFAANVGDSLEIYPYNVFRDWSRLIYDPSTGNMSLKKDYCGSLTIEIHNKVGDVLRNIYFPVLFPIEPLAQWDLEYNEDNIYIPTMKFAAENPTDLVVGGKKAGG